MTAVPSYLTGYETLYQHDPRAAARQWFTGARYGFFLHYGLYSPLGCHEWVRLRERIPVAEYAKLMNRLHAERFDADAIAAFARDRGMRYLTLTTRHHDGFCLFATAATPFNSVNAPAERDLAAELAAACERHGLGFFLYYSHGRDWRHRTRPTTTSGAARHGPPTTRPSRPTPTARRTTCSATSIS